MELNREFSKDKWLKTCGVPITGRKLVRSNEGRISRKEARTKWYKVSKGNNDTKKSLMGKDR